MDQVETSPQRGEDLRNKNLKKAATETSPQRGEDLFTKIILYIKILEKTDFYNIMIYIQIFKELLYHSNLFVIN